jgi:hypothetical protein
MSQVEPVAPAAASVGWLLRLGARAATSSALPVLALAGVFATSQVVWHVLAMTLLLGEPAFQLGETLLVSGAGLLVLASLTRAVVLAVAVQWGASRLRTAPSGGLSVARAGLRGIAWAALAVVVDQLLGAWFWGVLLASGAVTVLGGPGVSLLGATGVALVLTLGAFLFPAAALWLELGLVAAVTRPARTREAAPGPGWSAASSAGVAILLVSLVMAVATLIRLDALAALVLDRRGELPSPPPRPAPPAPAIPVASLVSTGEVVEARPVGPVSPWSPGGAG